MVQSRRVRAFRFTSPAVLEMLTGTVIPVQRFPDGIELVRYAVEWQTNSAVLILSHPDWEEVEPGREIPITDVVLRRIQTL